MYRTLFGYRCTCEIRLRTGVTRMGLPGQACVVKYSHGSVTGSGPSRCRPTSNPIHVRIPESLVSQADVSDKRGVIGVLGRLSAGTEVLKVLPTFTLTNDTAVLGHLTRDVIGFSNAILYPRLSITASNSIRHSVKFSFGTKQNVTYRTVRRFLTNIHDHIHRPTTTSLCFPLAWPPASTLNGSTSWSSTNDSPWLHMRAVALQSIT